MRNFMANIFGFSQPKKITDDGGSTGGADNGNNNGNGGQNGQNQGNQGDQNDDDSIFGNFVDPGDADSEFDLGDDFFKTDDDDSGQGGDGTGKDTLDEEQNRVLNEVHTAMKDEISRAVMADSEFQDFDPQDQSKIRKLLDTSMQRAAAAAVTAMMHPLKRTVDDAMAQMRREFQSGLQTNTVKTKAEQHFEPIGQSIMSGIKDKNMVAFAKQNFQMVLQRTKDFGKAQAATIQLLKTMGIMVDKNGRPARKASQFGALDDQNMDFGSGGNQNRGVKSGAEALDSFFPSSNRR